MDPRDVAPPDLARAPEGALRLSLNSRLRPSPKTLFRNVEGEAVLLGLSAGSYFGLDAVGTRIWELIAERGILRDVARGVVEEFEVEPARAESDLLRLATALLAKELVVLEAPQAS